MYELQWGCHEIMAFILFALWPDQLIHMEAFLLASIMEVRHPIPFTQIPLPFTVGTLRE